MSSKNKIVIIAVIFTLTVAILVKVVPRSKDEGWISLRDLDIPIYKEQSLIAPFREGEKFIYKVKLGALTIGSAELTFEGKSMLDARDVYVIVFEVNSGKIYDKEIIYAEPVTFYPLRVDRTVKVFGSSMKIQENYNQDEKFVEIHKTQRGKTTVKIIRSDSKLQNIISLVYFYRTSGLKDGSELNFNLPTQKVKMRVSKIDELRVPKGIYEAYLLESVPKKYRVWFDDSKDSIPLRIDGAISFGAAKMVLVETL
jgi:hypothetical protein